MVESASNRAWNSVLFPNTRLHELRMLTSMASATKGLLNCSMEILSESSFPWWKWHSGEGEGELNRGRTNQRIFGRDLMDPGKHLVVNKRDAEHFRDPVEQLEILCQVETGCPLIWDVSTWPIRARTLGSYVQQAAPQGLADTGQNKVARSQQGCPMTGTGCVYQPGCKYGER